jgi:hypothetical protein
MNTGAWLAIIGSAVALVALNLGGAIGRLLGGAPWLQRLLSPVYIEEFGYSGIAGFLLWPGQLAIAAALLALGCGWAALKLRSRPAAWGLVASGGIQLFLAWLTFDLAHTLVDCQGLPGAVCSDAGGLLPDTWLQLHGLVWLAGGGAVTLLGGALALVAPREYRSDQQFLQVSLLWGDQPVSQRVFYAAQPVTMGEDSRNTWQLPTGGLGQHRLFAPLATHRKLLAVAATDRYLLAVPAGVPAWLSEPSEEDPEHTRLIQGELLVQAGQSGGLSLGNGVELRFAFVQAEPGALLAGRTRHGEALAWSFAGVAMAAAVLWVVANAQPPGGFDDAAREDLAQHNRGLIEVAVQEPEPAQPPEPEGQERETTGKRAGGEEGRVGLPDADTQRTSRVPKSNAPLRADVDPSRIGLAAALGGAKAPVGALGNILAGDTGVLGDKLAVPSAGDGAELDFGHGSGAFGFRGTGSGGGDEGSGRLVGAGTIDTGDGNGRRADIGVGRKPKPRSSVGAALFREAPQLAAGCDKGDISKNVRARASSLRTCYEVQLSAHPTLSGKLTVQWTIGSDGSTSGDRVVSDTLQSPAVSDCVLRTIRRVRFQAPELGTCVVQWPFVFSPG